MEGDFKRPVRRPDAYGGRPQPQPSQRPFPVTDLRPEAVQPPQVPQPVSQPTPQYQPVSQPVPQYQPAPAPAPVVEAQPQPPEQPAAKPTTAELIAQHERETKPKSNARRNLGLAVGGLLIIIAGVLFFGHHAPKAKASGPFPASISASQVTIPVYYPKNLPAGFKVSGSKVVQQNVLNYVVTDANNDNFYVNIQAIPAGYDFNAFNKRFTGPTTYTTAIGTATQGLMNNELVASIQTPKSWVMINSTALKSAADMQTIAQALKPASL